MCACVCACARVCVRACVRVRVFMCARVRVRGCVGASVQWYLIYLHHVHVHKHMCVSTVHVCTYLFKVTYLLTYLCAVVYFICTQLCTYTDLEKACIFRCRSYYRRCVSMAAREQDSNTP